MAAPNNNIQLIQTALHSLEEKITGIFERRLDALEKRIASLEDWRYEGTQEANKEYKEIRKEIRDLSDKLVWFVVASIMLPLVFLVLAHYLWK